MRVLRIDLNWDEKIHRTGLPYFVHSGCSKSLQADDPLKWSNSMKVFVPLTDDMLDQLNGTETILPYQVGMRLEPQLKQSECGITFLADELPGDRLQPGPAPAQGRH